jgi:hypothetical protein
MYFGIFDSAGNALSWYDDEQAARAGLDRMVEGVPDAAENLVIFQFDDQGDPVGDAILPPRTKVVIEESQWLRPGQREKDAPAAARSGASNPDRTLVGA